MCVLRVCPLLGTVPTASSSDSNSKNCASACSSSAFCLRAHSNAALSTDTSAGMHQPCLSRSVLVGVYDALDSIVFHSSIRFQTFKSSRLEQQGPLSRMQLQLLLGFSSPCRMGAHVVLALLYSLSSSSLLFSLSSAGRTAAFSQLVLRGLPPLPKCAGESSGSSAAASGARTRELRVLW